MPLFKSFSPTPGVSIIIWKTEESVSELLSMIQIHPCDKKKMECFRNTEKLREFLALRCCLKEFFHSNPEVFYRESGKPFLKNGYEISFSHTHGYAAAIFSKDHKIGIDLETHRDSIQKIAPKFMSSDEFEVLLPGMETQQITYYWGAKEVIVKIEGDRRLNFIQQIKIKPLENLTSTEGVLILDKKIKNYSLFFEHFPPVYLSYGWEV